jgi:uroporphyrinogen III methyltransferase/synthase
VEKTAEALSRKPHWIAFGSSSTVKNLEQAAGSATLRGIKIASIGPVTSQTVRDCGLDVDAEADPHTIEGLIAALVHNSVQGSGK